MGTPEGETTADPRGASAESRSMGGAAAHSDRDPSAKPARRLVRAYIVVVVVIVVAVILAAYVLSGGFTSKTSSKGEVLVPVNTVDVIPGGQFDAITFEISSTSSINGSFFVTFQLVIYTMTPIQFQSFAKLGTVHGYEWTSGEVRNDSIYALGISVAPGAWDLVFDNPSPINTTAIGFYSDLTLTPG